jgi:hypothetical protein
MTKAATPKIMTGAMERYSTGTDSDPFAVHSPETYASEVIRLLIVQPELAAHRPVITTHLWS